MRARIVVGIAIVAGSAGCLSRFPFESEGLDSGTRRAAVGSVTVSVPLFRPLESGLLGDRRLDFAGRRTTGELWNEVQQANLSIADVFYRATEVAVGLAPTAAAVADAAAGGAANTGSTAQGSGAGDADGAEADGNENAATLPAPLAVDPKALESMFKLLERSSNDYSLPPDQVATLVAAYQTLMVNMEEFYNGDGFDFSAGRALEWLPYKVHFNVVVDPGWHTRERPHEAAVSLRFGASTSEPSLRVLAVMPPETAQTIDQLSSAFRQFATAIAGEGGVSGIDIAAQVRDVAAAARRLEGLRAHKPFVVSFPAENEIEIKFRPLVAPTAGRSDMQPQTRLLTALVLVRNRLPNGPEPAGQVKGDSATGAAATARESTQVRSLSLTNEVLGARATGDRADATVTLTSSRIEVVAKSAFVPCAVEEAPLLFGDGTLETPSRATFSFPWFVDGWKPLCAGERVMNCDVPPWLGDARASLEITSAEGLYWVKLDELAAARSGLVEAKNELGAIEVAIASIEKQLKALGDAKDDSAKAEVERLRNAHAVKLAAQPSANQRVGDARAALVAAIAKSLTVSAQLHFAVSGPIVVRWPGKEAVYGPAAFVARVLRLDRDDKEEFVTLGGRPGAYSFPIEAIQDGLEFDGLVTLDAKDELKFGEAQVLLEVGVVRASNVMSTEVEFGAVERRAIRRVTLRPGFQSIGSAETKPAAAAEKKDAIELKLGEVKLELAPKTN